METKKNVNPLPNDQNQLKKEKVDDDDDFLEERKAAEEKPAPISS